MDGEGRVTVHGVTARHPKIGWNNEGVSDPRMGPKRSPRRLVLSSDLNRSVPKEDKSTSASSTSQEGAFPSADSVIQPEEFEPKKKRQKPVSMEQVEFVKRKWNELAASPQVNDFSAIRKLTDDRIEKIKVRIREDDFIDNLPEVLKKIEASSFLSGRKPSKEMPNWRPTLFWLIRNSSRWVEILEGRYDDRDRELEPDRPIRPYELKNR